MKTHFLHLNKLFKSLAAMAFVLALSAFGVSAQNSLPAPGSGGGFRPSGGGFGGPGFGGPGFGGGFGPAYNPGPPPPPAWGNPWNNGYNPTVVISPTITVNNSANSGITKVIANGYDAMGVWRVVPLVVSYQYNGVQYNVNVLNAWNPWTDQWDKGVDQQAFSTDYVLRNVTYDFYVPLSFGTFYFNL